MARGRDHAARRRPRRLLLTAIALLLPPFAAAEEVLNPLDPPDRSSPRATLQSFIENVDAAHAALLQFRRKVQEEAAPGELDALRHRVGFHADRAIRCLDLSEVPEEIVEDVAIESTLQLKETLDRIALPPGDAVPDAEVMSAEDSTVWRLPQTEIEIGRVEAGPEAGHYLFTPRTVERIGEFYERIRTRPYRPGASEGLYEFYIYTPGGLIPTAVYWAERLPGWARVPFLGQAVWQWVGLVLCLLLGVGVLALVWRSTNGRAAAGAETGELGTRWRRFLRPVAAILVVRGVASITDTVVNITGEVLTVVSLTLGGLFYVAMVAAIWQLGGALAETIVSSQKLRARSIDSQLVRLGLRLFTLMIAAAITVQGAHRLGLPAYSILTGLGIGGLAVALAARESLANLLGSLVIMFERPIRVGDWVKVGDAEGTVEGVGFRSTRIRTFYNSLISIPNSDLVNSVLDNMGMRHYRRVRTFLQVTYDTPADKLEQFTTAVRDLILEQPSTWKGQCHVAVQSFAENGIEILLYFFLHVPDWTTEVVERQRILVEIMRKAEELGVSFAFPTRTLHMADAPRLGREAGDAAEGGLERAPQAGVSSPGPRRLP